MSAHDFRRALADVRCWDARTQAIYEAEGEPIDDCILQNREELIGLCRWIERLEIRGVLSEGETARLQREWIESELEQLGL